jgi:hypothetical protein
MSARTVISHPLPKPIIAGYCGATLQFSESYRRIGDESAGREGICHGEARNIHGRPRSERRRFNRLFCEAALFHLEREISELFLALNAQHRRARFELSHR